MRYEERKKMIDDLLDEWHDSKRTGRTTIQIDWRQGGISDIEVQLGVKFKGSVADVLTLTFPRQ